MKSVHNYPFLYLRGTTYYFRKSFFILSFDKSSPLEVKLSLRTGDLRIAKRLCLQLSLLITEFDECIRMAPYLQRSAMMETTRTYFRKYLEKCQSVAPRVLDSDPSILGHELECWKNQHQALLRSRSTGERAPLPDHGVLKNLGMCGVDYPPSNESNVFLGADIEVSRIMVAMYKGDCANAVPSDDNLLGTRPDKNVSPIDQQSPTVRQVAQKFVKYKSKDAWCQKTLVDQERVLGWLVDYAGPERPLASLEMVDMRSFRDGLLEMPSNAAKYEKLSGLEFAHLVCVGKEWPRVSVRTAKKYYEMATSFLEWCVDEGYLEASPAGKLRIKYSSNPQQARYPFSPDQLKLLFRSPLYTGCESKKHRVRRGENLYRDGCFWVPLVGLYSGMRLGEIIDLGLADIQEIDGILVFSIGGTEGEKRLKTSNAKRLVPVHEDLLRLGFGVLLEEARKLDKEGRVFGGLAISKTGYSSHNYSKWFSRYLTSVGIKTAKTTFHSLRHNFKDGLRVAGVPDGVQNRLMGHSDNGVASTYGSGWPINVLANEINRVSFSRFIDHLI